VPNQNPFFFPFLYTGVVSVESESIERHMDNGLGGIYAILIMLLVSLISNTFQPQVCAGVT